MPEAAFIDDHQDSRHYLSSRGRYLKSMKGEGMSDAGIEALRKAEYHEPSGSGHTNYQKAAAQVTGDPDKAFA